MLKNKKAFSLIELSVVILIIGVIIAGVTQSSRLINAVRLHSARAMTQSSPVSSIKDIILWYDATNEKSFDVAEADNGQAVSTWYDTNPHTTKYNVTSTSTARPTYTTNCLNSLPCLMFDGSNDFLVNNSMSIGGSEMTVFVVARRISLIQHTVLVDAILGGATDDYTNSSGFLAFFENTGTILQSHRGGGLSTATHPGNGVTFVATAKYDGTNNTTYLNGAAQTPAASSGSFNIGKLIIGSRWQSSANIYFYNGYFAEIIVFNRALKNEERVAVERYLGKKWGVTVA